MPGVAVAAPAIAEPETGAGDGMSTARRRRRHRWLASGQQAENDQDQNRDECWLHGLDLPNQAPASTRHARRQAATRSLAWRLKLIPDGGLKAARVDFGDDLLNDLGLATCAAPFPDRVPAGGERRDHLGIRLLLAEIRHTLVGSTARVSLLQARQVRADSAGIDFAIKTAPERVLRHRWRRGAGQVQSLLQAGGDGRRDFRAAETRIRRVDRADGGAVSERIAVLGLAGACRGRRHGRRNTGHTCGGSRSDGRRGRSQGRGLGCGAGCRRRSRYKDGGLWHRRGWGTGDYK